MTRSSPLIQQILDGLTALPGVGPKAAERMLYALLSQSPEKIRAFAKALEQLPTAIVRCERCGDFTTTSPCSICADRRRDQGLLCVVAEPTDLRALEKTGQYKGIYHVLWGELNALEGITPDDVTVATLLKRFRQPTEHVREVILALNPTVEGETTALYLQKVLRPFKIRVSKLARGLPLGAELDYADEVTLGDAIRDRREVKP